MTLIKREDAIDAICKEWCYVTYGNCPHVDDGFVCDGCDDVKALNALPSADAEWIPCSERLPSEDGCYLVCMAWEYENVEVLKWADGWNCYRDYDGKVDREHEIDGADIIAWMPLPEPYKGGDAE